MTLIGDLSLALPDGTILRDRTDVGLAEQWAAHVTPGWADLTLGRQSQLTSDALAELRRQARPGGHMTSSRPVLTTDQLVRLMDDEIIAATSAPAGSTDRRGHALLAIAAGIASNRGLVGELADIVAELREFPR